MFPSNEKKTTKTTKTTKPNDAIHCFHGRVHNWWGHSYDHFNIAHTHTQMKEYITVSREDFDALKSVAMANNDEIYRRAMNLYNAKMDQKNQSDKSKADYMLKTIQGYEAAAIQLEGALKKSNTSLFIHKCLLASTLIIDIYFLIKVIL